MLGLAVALIMGVRAQKKDITKFMGIPIDGTKAEMVEKIKAKGFTYNAKKDCLEGEFNGRDSYISVVTNRNKVYRIVVQDANYTDETQIKIRFNNLVRQFENSPKYESPVNQELDDDFKISYEIYVNKEQISAVFYQRPDFDDIDTTGIYEAAKQSYISYMAEEEKDSVYSEKIFVENYIQGYYLRWLLYINENKTVWFEIFERYGKYGIILYYDNEYNKSNGEDL